MEELTQAEIIECSCDCGMLKVEQFKDDGFATLSYYVPAFYAHQDNWFTRLRKNWGLVWSVLTGKQYQLFEIVIESNEDLNRFKAFVAQMKEIK